MEKSFAIAWGHSSIVFAQLAGFFELLTISDEWEYVINLSAYDYPIRYNDVIYQDILTKYQINGPVDFIKHSETSDSYQRLNWFPVLTADDIDSGRDPFGDVSAFAHDDTGILRHLPQPVADTATTALRTAMAGFLQFPYRHWKILKQDQWAILSRRAIEYLRRSPTAIYVAAFSEFTMIPDEVYIATVLLNVPSYDSGIVNDSKRMLEFPWRSIHPRHLDDRDLSDVAEKVQQGYGWCRKVDLISANDREHTIRLIRGIEQIRKQDWQHVFGNSLS